MSSDAADEFLEETRHEPREHVHEGDWVGLESTDIDGDRDPMTIIANPDTPTGDVHRLIARLQNFGYAIHREYSGDQGAAYTVYHPAYGGDSA